MDKHGVGKHFTMQGVDDSPELRGLIPCAFDHLFENNWASVTTEYLVQASYLEIYNKEVRDLVRADY